jgi:hypothetical protein
MTTTQISAQVSEATKKRLDDVSRSTGVKKGHLIEDALLHHMDALRELPADVVISPRIVVTPASAEEIARRIQASGQPTEGLRKLMGEGQ